jgi:hypothetical protein
MEIIETPFRVVPLFMGKLSLVFPVVLCNIPNDKLCKPRSSWYAPEVVRKQKKSLLRQLLYI